MSAFRIVDRIVRDPAAERRALAAAIEATPAAIPPKYFYDPVGCALYGAICELPEYYPTRTERAIFDTHRAAIAGAIGTGTHLVDLGAGDGAKAERWLPVLAPSRYLAVDIARDAIESALARMAPRYPQIGMAGVVTDFGAGLDLAGDLGDAPATFFYPGSSIGNFAPDDARAFVAAIRRHCTVAGSGLVIGVDTKKDKARLDAAYDDALGVTAAFNRNILRNVNRVLGSDFRPEHFAHRAFYDPARGRIEMHLEAIGDEVVRLPDGPRWFAAGERIHTENSYKYLPAEFTTLLHDAGFDRVQQWQDDAGDFAVFHAA
ncbi:MAG: L-histidine N(alpha)-methyltransferase [Betaproteobacteria bacterium]